MELTDKKQDLVKEFDIDSISVRGDMQIEVNDLIYEHNPMARNRGYLSNNREYKIYKIGRGKGQLPDYLITRPEEKVQLGINRVVLTEITYDRTQNALIFDKGIPIHMPDNPKIINKILKWRDCDVDKDSRKNWERIVDWHNPSLNPKGDPFMFQLTNPVQPESWEEIKSMSDEQINLLLNTALTQGLNVDERLTEINKALKLKVNAFNSHLKPKRAMIYQPHGIIIDRTKTFKSSQADLVGLRIDRGSIANLFGFSTANETNKGSLDEETRTVYLDEVVKSRVNESVYEDLNTYMEAGTVRINVGKKPVITEGFAPLVFMGNPLVR